MRKPLAIDIFAGLGGWADGLLAECWDVVGIDIEAHVYGEHRYPAGLIIQDALTVDGRAFSGAELIVASPPCQRYSWMAMPWSRAKAAAAAIRADDTGAELERLNALFNACFRIQREASEAAGRHIPLIVENVRGAIPWVGRSRWNFGSFHLWGDVPALMPAADRSFKWETVDPKWRPPNGSACAKWEASGRIGVPDDYMPCGKHSPDGDGRKLAGFRFDGSGRSFQSASVEHTGIKAPGMDWNDRARRGQDFTRIAGKHAAEGSKVGGDWFGGYAEQKAAGTISPGHLHGKNSVKRKAASAMIAKIPEPLARHIARCFHPDGFAARPRMETA